MSNIKSSYRFKDQEDENRHGRNVFNTFTAEFAKIGLADRVGTSDDTFGSGTKSEMLAARANLRRALQALRDHIGDKDPSDSQLTAMEEASRRINRISTQLDLDDSAAAAWGKTNSRSAGSWSNGDRGHAIVLAKDQRMPSLRADSSDGRIGFGEFVRAVAFGERNDRISNALGESAIGTGGATVPEILQNELIDRMRAKTVAIQAGARTVVLGSDTTHIARLETDPLAGWRLENAAVAESDPSFSRITFKARSLAVLVKVSRELLEDSINIDEALMSAFAGSMAVQLDAAALNGSGVAPEPRGVLNTVGIGAVSAAYDYESILDAIASRHAANSDTPTAMISAPAKWRTLQGLVDTTGQPLRAPKVVEDLPHLVTTTMPAAKVLIGNFSDLLIGVRSAMTVDLFREAFADKMQVGFIAHLRADVQLAHAASFVAIGDPP